MYSAIQIGMSLHVGLIEPRLGCMPHACHMHESHNGGMQEANKLQQHHTWQFPSPAMMSMSRFKRSNLSRSLLSCVCSSRVLSDLLRSFSRFRNTSNARREAVQSRPTDTWRIPKVFLGHEGSMHSCSSLVMPTSYTGWCQSICSLVAVDYPPLFSRIDCTLTKPLLEPATLPSAALFFALLEEFALPPTDAADTPLDANTSSGSPPNVSSSRHEKLIIKDSVDAATGFTAEESCRFNAATRCLVASLVCTTGSCCNRLSLGGSKQRMIPRFVKDSLSSSLYSVAPITY